MKYLNLGCGNRYLSDWTNVDFVSQGKEVIAYNLTKGIPFPDNSFDVVYHSHVLEHFTKQGAFLFIKECHRVLKPNGILRIAVPDLEEIIKEYSKSLSGALEGEKKSMSNYEWIMLELYDQTVRSTSGGEMGKYWSQSVLPNEEYIESRLGDEFIAYREKLKKTSSLFNNKKHNSRHSSKWKKFKNKLIGWIYGDKKAIQFLELGKFRMQGEIHQWMYDRYSLRKLLEEVGFKNCCKVSAFESAIPDWNKCQWLDIENKKVRKPDSLFMEAKK